MPRQKVLEDELVEVSWGLWSALSQLGFSQWVLSRAWASREGVDGRKGKSRATQVEVLNESEAEAAARQRCCQLPRGP